MSLNCPNGEKKEERVIKGIKKCLPITIKEQEKMSLKSLLEWFFSMLDCFTITKH